MKRTITVKPNEDIYYTGEVDDKYSHLRIVLEDGYASVFGSNCSPEDSIGGEFYLWIHLGDLVNKPEDGAIIFSIREEPNQENKPEEDV